MHTNESLIDRKTHRRLAAFAFVFGFLLGGLFLASVTLWSLSRTTPPAEQQPVTIVLLPREDGSLDIGLGDVRCKGETTPITATATGPHPNIRREVDVKLYGLHLIVSSDAFVRFYGVSLKPTYENAERRRFTDEQGNKWKLLSDSTPPTDDRPLKGHIIGWGKGPNNNGRFQFDEIVDWDRGIFRKWECLTSYNPPHNEK